MKKLFWLVLLLAILILACDAGEPQAKPSCDDLIVNCGDSRGDIVLVRNVKELSQESYDSGRSYRAFNCKKDIWFEGTVDASCVLWLE